jgi:hypothetical protein
MTDNAMCQNNECPIRDKCYRYRAIPSNWQSYSLFTFQDGKCDDFWKIEPGMRIKSNDPETHSHNASAQPDALL